MVDVNNDLLVESSIHALREEGDHTPSAPALLAS